MYIALKYVHLNSFYYIKKGLRLGIQIFADFDPIGYALSYCGSLYLVLWLFVEIHSRTLWVGINFLRNIGGVVANWQFIYLFLSIMPKRVQRLLVSEWYLRSVNVFRLNIFKYLFIYYSKMQFQYCSDFLQKNVLCLRYQFGIEN